MFGIVWGITRSFLLGWSRQRLQPRSEGAFEIHRRRLGHRLGRPHSEQAGRLRRRTRSASLDPRCLPHQAGSLPHQNRQPELRRSVSEVSRYNAASRPVRGVWPDYQRFRSLKVQEGRLMTDDDENESRRVVISRRKPRPVVSRQSRHRRNPHDERIALHGNRRPRKEKQNGSYGSGPDNTSCLSPIHDGTRLSPPNVPHFQGIYQQPVVRVATRQHERPAPVIAFWDASTISSSRQRRPLCLGHARGSQLVDASSTS